MKNRRTYIRAGLDMNRINSYANQSQAKHLGKLMDEQEELEQKDYNESTTRYMKTQVYQLESDFEDIVTEGFLDINSSVKSIIKQYNLDGCDLWVDIANSLGENGWRRGDGLRFAAEEDSGWIDIKLGATSTGMLPIMSYAVIESDNPDDYGNPDAAALTLDYFNAKNFCDVVYALYTDLRDTPNFDEIFEWGKNILSFILDDYIANDVTAGVEYCLEQNPPPLS